MESLTAIGVGLAAVEEEEDYYANDIPDIQVKHLEPWEKGTRKVQGMTGMCGGVSYLKTLYSIVHRI
uniref:Retrotransposon protein n=1 Tax=Heterorhabditis bacteriophora TaxID=37862 RepID=A0A1I7X3X7_HETBA